MSLLTKLGKFFAKARVEPPVALALCLNMAGTIAKDHGHGRAQFLEACGEAYDKAKSAFQSNGGSSRIGN